VIEQGVRAATLHRLARTLREVALLATENTGDDRANAGELAVLEDIARNPGSTISDSPGAPGSRRASSRASRMAWLTMRGHASPTSAFEDRLTARAGVPAVDLAAS